MKYRKILLTASALVLLGTAGCGKKEEASKEELKSTVQEEVQDQESQPRGGSSEAGGSSGKSESPYRAGRFV